MTRLRNPWGRPRFLFLFTLGGFTGLVLSLVPVDVQLQDGRLTSPANVRALDIKVVFETITGDTTTLDLGRVVPHG